MARELMGLRVRKTFERTETRGIEAAISGVWEQEGFSCAGSCL